MTFDILFWLGGKSGAGVSECGKHGTWKTRGLVENTWRGKHGVWWKTRDLSGKHGVKVKKKKKKKHWGTLILPDNEFSSSSYEKSLFCYFKLQ